jgi:hypothetical protein
VAQADHFGRTFVAIAIPTLFRYRPGHCRPTTSICAACISKPSARAGGDRGSCRSPDRRLHLPSRPSASHWPGRHLHGRGVHILLAPLTQRRAAAPDDRKPPTRVAALGVRRHRDRHQVLGPFPELM